MSNNRDEQFQGFATTVLDKMLSNKDGVMDPFDWWKEQATLILARAAYDLVYQACNTHQDREMVEQAVGDVSDMPEWHDEAERE